MKNILAKGCLAGMILMLTSTIIAITNSMNTDKIEVLKFDKKIVGEVIDIKLSDNPSTGYKWDILTAPELEVVNSVFEGPVKPMPGAPGTRTISFKVIKPSTYTSGSAQFNKPHVASLIYWQPFSGQVAKVKIVSISTKK